FCLSSSSLSPPPPPSTLFPYPTLFRSDPAGAMLADAPLRLLRHLDLGDQPTRCRIPAGEFDTGCFTDLTSSSVARDEIPRPQGPDRKSTRLNSSHVKISYAVFCLKKKK